MADTGGEGAGKTVTVVIWKWGGNTRGCFGYLAGELVVCFSGQRHQGQVALVLSHGSGDTPGSFALASLRAATR